LSEKNVLLARCVLLTASGALTGMCRLADCENQASVSDSENSSDEEVEDVDYENYYDY